MIQYQKIQNIQLNILDSAGNNSAVIPINKVKQSTISLKSKKITINGIDRTEQLDELNEQPQLELLTDAILDDKFFCSPQEIKLVIEHRDLSSNKLIKTLYSSSDCFFADRESKLNQKNDLVSEQFKIIFRSVTVISEFDNQSKINLKYDLSNLVIDDVVIYGAIDL